jgi:glycosyltransferase involved in cell wall biosynthesis
MSTNNKPFVSVVTPTYNRARFVPAMVGCYKSQIYPKDRMEWIVLDDGTISIEEQFLSLTKGLPNIRYIRLSEKLNIGAKRNILNKEAKGEIIISMDDDDFYSPERVSHVVTKCIQNPSIELVGCSELYMYYSDDGTIIKLGPYNKKHATNGTMAVRSRYAKTHLYDETVTHAEEHSFLEEYKHPMIQLDPMKVMLVMSHSENTFDKTKFRTMENNPFVKKTSMKIRDFIKDKTLRDFYATA